MENNLEKLIGAQLVRLTDYSMVVNLNGEEYVIEINSTDGDCCGYSNVESILYYSPKDLRNPIITNIEILEKDEYDSETVILTIYGENKQLASVETNAGSGSGWTYGACVWLECSELKIDNTLASW